MEQQIKIVSKYKNLTNNIKTSQDKCNVRIAKIKDSFIKKNSAFKGLIPPEPKLRLLRISNPMAS
jgi:hypothetical protein